MPLNRVIGLLPVGAVTAYLAVLVSKWGTAHLPYHPHIDANVVAATVLLPMLLWLLGHISHERNATAREVLPVQGDVDELVQSLTFPPDPPEPPAADEVPARGVTSDRVVPISKPTIPRSRAGGNGD